MESISIYDLLALARKNIELMNKQADSIQIDDVASVSEFRSVVTPSLVEALCLRIIELESYDETMT
ncbi:TPA: hypothetical protein ACW5D6_004674 [Salmonella enterica subsp. enterica serovar Saintpaul]|nr:hypothetical protein [Escherichia coli]